MFHIYIVVSCCQQEMFQKNLKKSQNVCPSCDQKLPEIGVPQKILQISIYLIGIIQLKEYKEWHW